jgi:hypothetical protein
MTTNRFSEVPRTLEETIRHSHLPSHSCHHCRDRPLHHGNYALAALSILNYGKSESATVTILVTIMVHQYCVRLRSGSITLAPRYISSPLRGILSSFFVYSTVVGPPNNNNTHVNPSNSHEDTIPCKLSRTYPNHCMMDYRSRYAWLVQVYPCHCLHMLPSVSSSTMVTCYMTADMSFCGG